MKGKTDTQQLSTTFQDIVQTIVINLIILLGGKTSASPYCTDDILVFLDDTQEWIVVGKMKVPRKMHAVTTINLVPEVMDYCK